MYWVRLIFNHQLSVKYTNYKWFNILWCKEWLSRK
jgi:hypothetical protein